MAGKEEKTRAQPLGPAGKEVGPIIRLCRVCNPGQRRISDCKNKTAVLQVRSLSRTHPLGLLGSFTLFTLLALYEKIFT